MATDSPVPDPPDFSTVVPHYVAWGASDPIIRVFNPAHGPTSFNSGFPDPGVHGRFHFFEDAAGAVVPVLYGSDHDDGAISETIFHDVPVAGAARTVLRSRLDDASIVTLRATRELTLVGLLGHGLRRLQIRATNLTDTEPGDYVRTVSWARAIHQAFPTVDGMVWMSRQFNASRALVLFGDRVGAPELGVVVHAVPLRLGPGRARVDRAANESDILII